MEKIIIEEGAKYFFVAFILINARYCFILEEWIVLSFHGIKEVMLELIYRFSDFASSASTTGLSSNSDSLYTLVIFVAIIVTLRLYRGINGRIYSQARVLRAPAIYIILTLLTVIPSGISNIADLGTLILIPVGLIVGYRFGTNVTFFRQNGVVYYKRSQIIMIVWLLSLIIRLVMEILYPASATAILAVNILLTVTTGLIIGEAMNIIKKEREFNRTDSQDPGVSA